MVVGFTSNNTISAYHHWCCEFESRSWQGVQHYVIKFVWLTTGRWFSPGPPISSNNKTDRHNITEILLKVALNTIKQTNKQTRNTIVRQKNYTDIQAMIKVIGNKYNSKTTNIQTHWHVLGSKHNSKPTKSCWQKLKLQTL
jgi:hypothetical protein